MDVFVTPGDDRSLVTQIHDQLRDAIADGRLPIGSRLAPSRALAAELQVSRSTVTDAYERLTAEGYVEGRRGGGTVVVGGTLPRSARPEPPHSEVAPTLDAATIGRYGPSPVARYDLTAGRVDWRLFPSDDWRRCVLHALRARAQDVGHYGDPVGSLRLRRAIAQWVAQTRGIATTPDQVVATQGTSQTIDLLGRVLLRPGDVAAVEEPGYPPVTSVLRSQGIEVVGVPVDEDGLVVDALPSEARLVHVTPSHHYPLGSVLSLERRLALVHWAHQHQAVVVEDDYDSDLRYVRRPVEPLYHLDSAGRVVYGGTFSKVLSPSLRMAFAVVPPSLVAAMIAMRQALDGGPPAMLDGALAQFIDEGYLARHLRRSRRTYAARHQTAMRELQRLAPPQARVIPTQTGLHITLLIPDAPGDDILVERAAEQDLIFSSLRRTYQFSEGHPGIIVGFGAIATADVPTAIERLMACVR